jgi:hypothetical protein
MRRRFAVSGALALAATTAVAVGVSSSIARAPATKPLFASMTGAAEVPGPGDTNGLGAASVVFTGGNKICYSLVVNAIAKPVAAHIHAGKAGVAGDVVVTLAQPAKGSNGTSAACVASTAEIVNKIKANPKNFYVNVHTGAFPGGAIRGQLHR